MNDMSLIAQPVPPDVAEEFFRHNESLAAEQLRRGRRSVRVAWTVATGACLTAMAACFALAVLGPQHDVEWRLVRVDSSTGIIDEVQSLREAPKTLDDANIKSLLDRYVMQREGYTAAEAEYNFHAVSLMSTPDEQHRYAALVSGRNPTSPQALIGKDGTAIVHIKSVAVLASGLGQVRFSTKIDKPGQEPKIAHWLATINYMVKPEARMSNADRLINPVGFIVSEYRIDPDQP